MILFCQFAQCAEFSPRAFAYLCLRMKTKIFQLLDGDTFAAYLQGLHAFAESIHTRALPQRDIDAALMQRICACTTMEQWAEHDDFIAQLEDFVAHLVSHGDLISRQDAVGQAFRGIVGFVNGIPSGQHNLSGFKTSAGSGWLLSQRGGAQIAEYYASEDRAADAAFFNTLSTWFGQIVQAQTATLQGLREVADWSIDSASGFMEVLPFATPYFQGLLLDALELVVENPVVKMEIIERYLQDLRDELENLIAAEERAEAATVQKRIQLLQEKRWGKVVDVDAPFL
jgi:hypothetical protein